MFKNIEFGDKFVTRNGSISVFLEEGIKKEFGNTIHFYRCYNNELHDFLDYDINGKINSETYTVFEDGSVEEYDEDIISKIK